MENIKIIEDLEFPKEIRVIDCLNGEKTLVLYEPNNGILRTMSSSIDNVGITKQAIENARLANKEDIEEVVKGKLRWIWNYFVNGEPL
jgi:hypothetical protein